MQNKKTFLPGYIGLCIAMSGLLLGVLQLQRVPFFEPVILLKGLGLLALYFYIVYRISEQLQSSVLKWGWIAACCMCLPFLTLAFTDSIALASSILIIGAVYHAMLFIKNKQLYDLILGGICACIAVALKHHVLAEACIFLLLIIGFMFKEKEPRSRMMLALVFLLLCLSTLAFDLISFRLTAHSSSLNSWRSYTASLALLLTAGHSALYRFYFYFVGLIGFGLFFFCTKNTPYGAYLKNPHLLLSFVFLGSLVGISLNHAVFKTSFPSVTDSIELYLLFVLSFLGLVQEVSSFEGRARTVNLARILLLLPVFQIYLLFDLF